MSGGSRPPRLDEVQSARELGQRREFFVVIDQRKGAVAASASCRALASMLRSPRSDSSSAGSILAAEISSI